MIKISIRDKADDEWIQEKLQEGKDYGNYSYYDDMSKVKKLQFIYKEIQSATELAIKQFKKLVPLYKDIHVTHAKNLQGAIARYIADTSTNIPIILIGVDATLKSVKSIAKRCSMDNSKECIERVIYDEIYPAIITSIYHEMGHAIIDELRQLLHDIKDSQSDLWYENEEDIVEDFARDLYDDESISRDMMDIIKELKRARIKSKNMR